MTFDASATEALTATTFVPNTHLMSGLLGPRDEHLRVVERSFPDSKIRVQGNQNLRCGAGRREGTSAL